MRIALTYNLKRSGGEDESEFDTRETIDALAGIVADLGHAVIPIEVARPIPELAALLAALAPDLVFNLAEGTRGRFREAFYPALFEQLGLPFTGSDAGVLAVALDKSLTNRIVSAAGVPTPRSRLIQTADGIPRAIAALRGQGPWIVKPNYEGSSKGITTDSIAIDRAAAPRVASAILARYPDGVLIEELIPGLDVSVGWIEGLGVLAPASHHYAASEPFPLYDRERKRGGPALVHTRVPAAVATSIRDRLIALTRRAVSALGITGYGRADYRVTPSGDVYFLEINPLPALAPEDGYEIYDAAALAGASRADVVGRILSAAIDRFGLANCQFVSTLRTA
jgi:D-alanine-D-alanine ligase